ncbi:MAG: DNA internalization-related competence protein ComEC/Rec2 [Aeromicrobium sp.]|nr:MAG: DNA internalization-related competence protein ComEC/Rec2 [Aeromicrobium sp.]
MRGGHDVRLAPAAIGAWLAVIALLNAPASWSLVVVFASLCVVAYTWSRFDMISLTFLILAIVLTGLSWRLAALDRLPWDTWGEERREAQVEAVVMTDFKTFANDSTRGVVRVRLTQIAIDGQTHRVKARASIALGTDVATPALGDRLEMRVRLRPSTRPSDVVDLSVLELEIRPHESAWWHAADRVRVAIVEANTGEIESGPPIDRDKSQGAALVPALVMGDESALSEITRSEFQRAGLTHLLAVSGANLTIVLAVVLGLLRLCGMRRLLVVAGLLVTVAFVMIARPEPSVQRAAVMGVVAVMGLGRARSAAGLRALAWAVIVLLTLDPWLARDFGFALSVLATGGIVCLAEPLAQRFEAWAPRWLALSFAVPLAAQLACLPVVAVLTQEVSLVSLAANMLAAITVAPATVMGLLAGLLHLVWAPLAIPFAWLAWLAGTWIVLVGQWSAGAVGAAVPWIVSPFWLVPVAILVLLALLRWGHSAVFMTACTLVLALVIVRPSAGTWLPEDAVLVACDVGQGDAFILPLTSDSAIVIDAGESGRDIDRCLRDLNISHVPLVVLTHAHADHVGGWAGLERRRDVGEVLVGSSGAPMVPAVTTVVAGDSLRVGDTRIEVVWPRTQHASNDPNNDSIVMKVEHRGISMLFTGDIGAETAQRLAADIEPVDVLKIPHHGSGDMWPGLIELTQPRVALIGVGAENRYGHPHASVTNQLEDKKILTGRTDTLGTFAVVANEGQLSIVQR